MFVVWRWKFEIFRRSRKILPIFVCDEFPRMSPSSTEMAGVCASLLDSNIRRMKCEKRWANCVYVPLENLYINEKYVENAKHKHLSLKYSANFPSNIKHFSFWLKIFQIFRQCMLSCQQHKGRMGGGGGRVSMRTEHMCV